MAMLVQSPVNSLVSDLDIGHGDVGADGVTWMEGRIKDRLG